MGLDDPRLLVAGPLKAQAGQAIAGRHDAQSEKLVEHHARQDQNGQ
jgi:hypothetical protein